MKDRFDANLSTVLVSISSQIFSCQKDSLGSELHLVYLRLADAPILPYNSTLILPVEPKPPFNSDISLCF